MQYFVLLLIFPPEIVNIIYKFILKNKSAYLIYYNMKTYNEKEKIIFKSIKNIVYDNYNYNNNQTYLSNSIYKINSDDNILLLKFIYENYYSKKKYNNNFWKNYLNLLSSRLMILYNIICFNNLNINNQTCYKNFKKIVYYWFQLCKKYNIFLKIGMSDNLNNITNNKIKILYIKSNYIKNIKNFNKFLFPPNVIDYYDPITKIGDTINITSSYQFLREFITLYKY